MVGKVLNLKRFFFFQAEDGIRDYDVTGVQTCALPISRAESDNRSGHYGDSHKTNHQRALEDAPAQGRWQCWL